MAYFKNLITDKILKNRNAIQAQRLASCMAWQILNDYPTRQKPSEWKIYNNLRGVMLADEVGGGKTFETLAIISKAILEQTSKSHSKDRFRVLIIANPSIRSKWEWNEKEDLTFEEFERYFVDAYPSSHTRRTIFEKYNPGFPFDYKFADEQYAKKFNYEELVGKLAAIVAFIAIFISCLGLFGLASFMAEQRTKEIGVRKVLGASVFNLWQLM